MCLNGQKKVHAFEIIIIKWVLKIRHVLWHYYVSFVTQNHVTEAKQMIEIVGEIPRDRLQNDSDSRLSSTFGEYKDFMGELLKQLQ